MVRQQVWKRGVFVVLFAALAACASTPKSGSDFNGEDLSGWRATPPWYVDSGSIICPNSNKLEPPLASTREITGPCEVQVDLKLLRRNIEDGRGFWLSRDPKHESAGEVHVRIDNSPNEFQLKVLPDGPTETAKHELKVGEWYKLTCRIDAKGQVTATLDGSTVLSTHWPYGFPLTLGLECQRSGAAFRRVDVRDL